MSVYKSSKNRALVKITDADRINGQIALYGTNPSYSVDDGVFFLEYLEVESGGSATIKDGSGDTMGSGVITYFNSTNPLRCDLGITITGSVTIAQGFVIRGVY